MDTKPILAELRAERQRIDQAITALESLDHAGSSASPATSASLTRTATSPKRRRMSAAGRKRISEAAKAMWAERKKKARTPRHMSAATRKRLSELAKQRWAERKKKAKPA
jgi:hypothetical protein